MTDKINKYGCNGDKSVLVSSWTCDVFQPFRVEGSGECSYHQLMRTHHALLSTGLYEFSSIVVVMDAASSGEELSDKVCEIMDALAKPARGSILVLSMDKKNIILTRCWTMTNPEKMSNY